MCPTTERRPTPLHGYVTLFAGDLDLPTDDRPAVTRTTQQHWGWAEISPGLLRQVLDGLARL